MRFHDYKPLKTTIVQGLIKYAPDRVAELQRALRNLSSLEYAQIYIDEMLDVLSEPMLRTEENRKDKIEAFNYATTFVCEIDWHAAGRPFYNVYPIIEQLIQNTKLNVPLSVLSFPYDTLCFRFAEGHEPYGICSALLKVSNFETPAARKVANTLATIGSPVDAAAVTTMGCMVFTDGVRNSNNAYALDYMPRDGSALDLSTITVEEMLQARFAMARNALNNDVGDQITRELKYSASKIFEERLSFIFRLAVVASMLHAGHDLITPIVLAKHKDRYDKETNEAARKWLEDKAAKIQGRGFDFGKQLQRDSETSPHWRSPHMALFWTGEGRKKPVLKLRAGCVVVPKTLNEVPTGFFGPETPDETNDAHAATQEKAEEHVYFLRDPSCGFVKIGRTRRNIAERQRESSTFVPGGLVLLGYITTGNCTELETRIHREYAEHRCQNEFFRLQDAEVRKILTAHGGTATEHLGQAV